MSPPRLPRTLARRLAHRSGLAAAATALLLPGCGGGLYLNFGSGCCGGAPDVSLAASASVARSGETVRLVAAASDDAGIGDVAFYRIDATGSTLLGHDASAPYEWPAVIPAGAAGSVQFFAIATDVDGLQSQSPSVAVGVLP